MGISKDGRKLRGAEVLRRRAIVTREEARRLDRFVMKAGNRYNAAARLGVGRATVAAASEEGATLLQETYDRLMTALEREERAA